jgi:putative Mg2+ transporter-C (MgtC) family protein
MSLYPDAMEIVLRLALAAAAGALIGLEREAKGRPAGLRTTILVSLAAAIAMIQMDLLLPVDGKGPGSFSVMDVMRLPLGILSGMGFIGGAVILRREEGVLGVTTAATLWLTTVVGLCFGGGQLLLGGLGTASALVVLTALRGLEDLVPREYRAVLVVSAQAQVDLEEVVLSILSESGIEARFLSARYASEEDTARISFDVRWRKKGPLREPSGCLLRLRTQPDVVSVEWKSTL